MSTENPDNDPVQDDPAQDELESTIPGETHQQREARMAEATAALGDAKIVYERGNCFVAYKPGGLLTQAAPGIDSLEVRLKRYLKIKHPEREPYLGVPHRLDRPVSGCLVFGKNKDCTRGLSKQFELRTVKKKYWALVQGTVEPVSGSWTNFMRKVHGSPVSELVEETEEGAQYASLRYTVVQQVGSLTWLQLVLETGRTHQIRLQTSSRQHPILGDELYGSKINYGPDEVDERKRWIALHACELAFRHPERKRWVTAKAPLPSYWSEVEPTYEA